jgi:hypothetical protein
MKHCRRIIAPSTHCATLCPTAPAPPHTHLRSLSYAADVVGDVYLRERLAWGFRVLLQPGGGGCGGDGDVGGGGGGEKATVITSTNGNLLSWDFDSSLLTDDERVSLVVSGFALLGFVEKFQMPARKLCCFVSKCLKVGRGG